MAAREFDDVAALVNTWRGAIDKTKPRPGGPYLMPPDIRAAYHVARGLDDGRITDGLGDQLAAEATEYLRSQS